ncbi:MAG: hypothetical protein IJY61_03470 [Candidatus Gastranaerophilales bacterium]|nr:hypothetical protein [Candidatus Gastranaerophilales bacterium]
MAETKANLSQVKKYIGNPTTGFYPRLIVTTPDQRFDYEMATGTKLSNGSTLIKPVILSLGKVDVKRMDNGKYKISSSATENTLTMTEEELLETKWIARGSIKEMDEDRYMLCYSDRDGKDHIEETTKEGAMQILSNNVYYM